MSKPSTAPKKTVVVRGAAANRAQSADALASTLDGTLAPKAVARTATEKLRIERDTAVQRGYEDGLRKAQAEVEAAMSDANTRVHRALAALCEAADSFDQRQAVALVDVEDAIAMGALAIASAVLQKELTVMADPGAEALARALALAPDRGDMIARLHPEDAATLSMDSVSTSTRTVHVVADPTIEPGGCVVDAGNARIDAQISTALDGVRQALKLNDDLPIEQTAPPRMEAPSSTAAGRSASSSRTTASEAPTA